MLLELHRPPGLAFAPIGGSATESAAQLLRHGIFLARGLYPRDWILDLGERVAWRYDRLAEQNASGDISIQYKGWLEARSFPIADIQMKGSDAAQRLGEPIAAIAALALGGPVGVHQLSFARRVEPDDVEDGRSYRLPFHQDQQILKASLVNIWTPMSDCGVSSPGLEVVARHLTEVEVNAAHDRNIYGSFGAEIPADWVTTTYRDDLVAPEMSAGDALVFLGTTIHRTHIAPGMTHRRDSVDLRFMRL